MNGVFNCFGHKLLFDNIVSANNCTLTDAEGHNYLDLESGVWCTSIGHSHPKVNEVICQNVSKIMHSGYCYNSKQLEETAKNILRITRLENGQCLFLCSGSEAVDLAINISKHITKKPLLLTMKDSYLSAFGTFIDNEPNKWYKHNWLEGERIEKIPFEQISAFIFEPGSSSGLVRFPSAEVIEEIVQRTRKNGGLVIANEVTTGIGRTGKWFGYNHYNIQPDIVVMGKGLGNGYPVSCITLSHTTVSKINLNEFHYGQSHQNDPMGAAVANTVINTIEKENLLTVATEKGNYIKKKIHDLKAKYGIIKEVRGRGLMLAIEFDHHSDQSLATIINNKLLERRIILVKRPDHEVFRIDPSLTITQDDIDLFLSSLEEILEGIKKCG